MLRTAYVLRQAALPGGSGRWFKLDENVPVELLDDLRAAGHEAGGLRDEGLTGASDDVVLDLVRRERRVLLTLDKGIADVRAHPPVGHCCQLQEGWSSGS
jgi:predicted nuclease of predicted toxin-antitoxin system